jgi:ribonuclease P protein component
MLNKKNCLSNRRVIEKLFKKGKLYKDQFFVFKYEEKANQEPQFAVSVSKKISNKATVRNHLRRQIHEALRLNLNLLKKPIIALVIVRPSVVGKKLTFQDISQEVTKFFNTI